MLTGDQDEAYAICTVILELINLKFQKIRT